ncbi:formyl transferase [Zunongwangia profunda SM-A87]|uniref:phosphoribosylglycinamide formyltransferase 1 n=1 Tax=Zunongwangia profunda (strain DSM 18752 / CCTCC AB 206139 / SM-A87) TaxID=655815 RepID=D5BIK7_ZUNPS|nr:formyl transferase [Zunongwangia profunda SM-A87]
MLFTSDAKRHKYIAKELAEHTSLQLIVDEKKSVSITKNNGLNDEDTLFWKNHFKLRENSEKQFFKDIEFPENVELLSLEHGKINSELVQEKLKEIRPDFIILFGTSIIKRDILNLFPNKFINLHLGLSPYYKGSATNLFPFYYKEPECVGATIHIASEKVDAGAILCQLRPEIEVKDDMHTTGNKVILKAGKLLPKILQDYNSGKIDLKKQSKSGKELRIKDLNISILKEIYKNFEQGMIIDYIRDKEQRDLSKPIVNFNF